jgi:hypothetical protein
MLEDHSVRKNGLAEHAEIAEVRKEETGLSMDLRNPRMTATRHRVERESILNLLHSAFSASPREYSYFRVLDGLALMQRRAPARNFWAVVVASKPQAHCDADLTGRRERAFGKTETHARVA